jgi:hypothetical protein
MISWWIGGARIGGGDGDGLGEGEGALTDSRSILRMRIRS